MDNQFLRTDANEGASRGDAEAASPTLSSSVPPAAPAQTPTAGPLASNESPTAPLQSFLAPRTPASLLLTRPSRFSPKLKIIGTVVLVSAIVIGSITAFIVQRSRHNTLGSQTASNFATQNIPLAQLNNAGNITLNGKTLSVNGQLRANGSLIMTPAVEPMTPTTGQLYYDQTSNHLKYYNGTEFVQIQTDKDATGGTGTTTSTTNNNSTTINNVTNLSVVNNTAASNQLSGTTGRIAKFTSGQTLGDSLLTDQNTFLQVDGGINLLAASSTQDLSFWTPANIPTQIDTTDTTGSLELGTKFQVDVPGTIKSLRFYKATIAASNTITISLWNSTGSLLGQATGTVAGSGWQQIDFNAPITVSPDTTYVASYHLTDTPGQAIGYPFDTQYFRASGVDNGPLHALASGLDGGNGVFKYTNVPAAPTQTFNSTNYWVDVVFSGSQFTNDSRIRINGAQLSSSDLSNDSNLAKRGSSQVFSGHNIFRNASDSVDEFSIQRADTTELFSTDSANNRVYVGPQSGGGDTLLVLNNRLGTGDPPNPTDGAMYYQATEGVFRCYSNGAWSTCSDPQPTRSYTMYDDFMGGQGGITGTIGSLGWSAQAIGANGSLSFNPSTPTPVADRPGVLNLQTPAVANQGSTLSLGGSNGSMILKGNVVMRTAVAIGATTGQVMRIGLHNESASTTQPVSGVWWEANLDVNANWQYCYGNGTTATCSNSSIAIVANSWTRLTISVIQTGAGNSSAVFTIGNISFSVSGVTIDSTNRVSPALTCYSTDGTARNCYWDYFQLTGITSGPR